MTAKHRQFAEFIDTRRKDRGLTMEQLAGQVGTSKSNVHAWLRGEYLPKAGALEPLAQALDVSYEDLFARAGYSHPEGLPEFQPYLRAKYGELPEAALAEADAFFDQLTKRYDEEGGDADKPDR